MTGRVRVASLDGGVERLDRLEQRRLELARRLHEVVLTARRGRRSARACAPMLRARGAQARARGRRRRSPTAYQIVPRALGDDRRHDGVVERDLGSADGPPAGVVSGAQTFTTVAAPPRRGRPSAAVGSPAAIGSPQVRARADGGRRDRDGSWRRRAGRCVRRRSRPRTSSGSRTERPSPRSAARRRRDLAAADDGRRESGVDVGVDVAGGVLEGRLAQVAREPSRRARRRRRRGSTADATRNARSSVRGRPRPDER